MAFPTFHFFSLQFAILRILLFILIKNRMCITKKKLLQILRMFFHFLTLSSSTQIYTLIKIFYDTILLISKEISFCIQI